MDDLNRLADAFTRPVEQTDGAIAAYEAATDIHRFYRESMPSLTKVSENRREVKAYRQRILAALR